MQGLKDAFGHGSDTFSMVKRISFCVVNKGIVLLNLEKHGRRTLCLFMGSGVGCVL
jgi:hypothetical protein